MTSYKKAEPKLDKAMRESLKAYSAGDRHFFDFLRNDVRVYTLDSSAPILGREAFESYFGPTFIRTKRQVEIMHSDIQLSGSQAVLAQTLQITANEINSFVRQTVIWEQDPSGNWQMSHIHNAQVGQPILITNKSPKTADEIRVLNERIATVAATVGVAQ